MTSSISLKKLSMFIAASALISLGLGGAAEATVINFETLSDREVVNDQFLDLGVDFNGQASVLSSVTGSLNSASFPPFSGSQVIYDDPALTSGILRINAVGSLWSTVGGYVTGNRGVTLTAFAADNSILGTSSTGGPNFVGAGTGLPPNIFLSVTAPNIAYVTFSDQGNTYTVDDFTFTPISVPEPSSVLGTFIFGASSVGFLLKRKQQQKA